MRRVLVVLVAVMALFVGCTSREEKAATRVAAAKKQLLSLTPDENLYCSAFLQIASASLDFKSRGSSADDVKAMYAKEKIPDQYPFINKMVDHVYKVNYNLMQFTKTEMNNFMSEAVELCMAEVKVKPELAKDAAKKMGGGK